MTTFISLHSAMTIHAMEAVTKNKELLPLIDFPQDIQTKIALSSSDHIDEFILVAKILTGYPSLIESIAIQGNTIEISSCSLGKKMKRYYWKNDKRTLLSAKLPTYITINSRAIILGTISVVYNMHNHYSNSSHALDEPRFSTENIFTKMQTCLTVPQADLITRAYRVTKEGDTFTIYAFSEDGKVFLTFDKEVRMALLARLNIELKTDWAPVHITLLYHLNDTLQTGWTFMPNCVIQ